MIHVISIQRQRYLAWFVGIVGGILVGIALLKGGVLFIWIGITCLWASKGFPFAGFLWGGIATLLSHSWLLALHPLTWIGVQESLSLPITIFIWLFCGFFGGTLVGIWSLLGKISFFEKVSKSSLSDQFVYALVLSLIWGLAEVILSKGPLFWFGLGGSVLLDDRFLGGLARWFGAGGLATVQLLIGWWLWKISNALRRSSPWLPLFTWGFVFVLASHLLGVMLLTQQNPSSTKRVALWQTNIPTREKFSLEELKRLPIALENVLQKADALGANWLIAPEGTISIGQELISPSPISLISGGFRWIENEQRSSLLVFQRGDKNYSNAIDKHRLVPLGEWLPNLPGVTFKGLSFVGGLKSGEESRLLTWHGPPIAVAICYELSDGSALSKATFNGAQWILTIANLDPYPISLQKQFLALSQLRSIESARELISVANSGPTSIISSTGKVKSIVPPFKEGLEVVDINFSNDISGYVRFREIPLIVALFLCLWKIGKLKSKN